MARANRSRRSCLAVPGSSPRFLAKASGLAADEVFLDLEDAVAPDAKEEARRSVIGALRSGDWRGKLMAVRINGATTRWAYRDVIELAERAGISTNTLHKVEQGDPSVCLGTALDVATLVGVPLFYEDRSRLAEEAARSRDRAALLPQRVRQREGDLDNDF